MKYLSKKDHTTVAEFVSQNEKTSVIRLKYLNGEQEGKCVDISPTTLQRWWKKMVEDEIPEVEVPAETLHIEVVTDEGEKIELDIDPNATIDGVDNVGKIYDFNPTEKKHIPEPESAKLFYTLGDDPYPTVDEVVDLLVSWGADVKAYAEWIKMTNGMRVLFRRNRRSANKSVIEVRMKEEIIIPGYETVYAPVKSALIKNEPYTIYAKTIKDLEQVVKSLLAATR